MAHLHYSEQIAEKTFRGSSTKDAYMRAVKWCVHGDSQGQVT